MTPEELKQLFDNKSDCYADSHEVIPAMTRERFVEVVGRLIRDSPATSDSEEVSQYEIAPKIVMCIGEYVNRLDRRDLGVPTGDEVAVAQMADIVTKILADPTKEVEIQEYLW